MKDSRFQPSYFSTRARQNLAFVLALVFAAASFNGSVTLAQDAAEVMQIRQVLTRYVTANYARDFKNAYGYISAQDRRLKDEAAYVRERGSFHGFISEVARQLAASIEVSVLEHRIAGSRAYVKMDLRAPDPEKVAPLVHGWNEDSVAEEIRQLRQAIVIDPNFALAQAYLALLSAFFACSATLANAAGWCMASSARLLRSSSTPAALRPLMSWP